MGYNIANCFFLFRVGSKGIREWERVMTKPNCFF
jgi:hypothetical protein